MSSKVSSWLSKLTRFPGHVSFRAAERIVTKAGSLEAAATELNDEALQNALRSSITPPPALPTALHLSLLREAARRSIKQRPTDAQLVLCCALVSGNVAEMDTGEGKTLGGALAATSFALNGRRVHVISVNDYLARRDADWMRPLFNFAGSSSSSVSASDSTEMRRKSYAAQIVYVSAHEVGCDTLRDRFVHSPAERVSPATDVAIIDEADSVLIDEAMVPLVLAGETTNEAANMSAAMLLATALADSLVNGLHYDIDAERTVVSLTDDGLDWLEQQLGSVNLYAAENIHLLTQINLSLHARLLVERDVDYLVDEDGIKLISASRGRVTQQQRWPDGLHSAIEAKEGLLTSDAGQILDSLTLQDLLTSYRLLCGMSGTAVSVASEFLEFYRVPVGRISRSQPLRRVDHPTEVHLTSAAALNAMVALITDVHSHAQPVLIGTRSVAESELVAAALNRVGLAANVLNAKNDASEAAIISRAGEPSTITISTQMSGRGTDIRLGGQHDDESSASVVASGGLAVIAAGRYPSQRLDAQLRGRSGRQGDPGSTFCFTSLDDPLVTSHAPDHLLRRAHEPNEGLDQAARLSIVETAQRIAEGIRRDRHRATWAYSRAIAAQRQSVLRLREEVLLRGRPVRQLYAPPDQAAHEDSKGTLPQHLDELERAVGKERLDEAVRLITLYCLDDQWTEHLALLNEVRDGIHLRSLAGLIPADEFHIIALKEFAGFEQRAYDRSGDYLSRLRPAQIEANDLDSLGLKRPSATWTYMVTDDPLGNAADKAVRTAAAIWRQRVLGYD